MSRFQNLIDQSPQRHLVNNVAANQINFGSIPTISSAE
jgi:ribosome biogenesis protein Tsr3